MESHSTGLGFEMVAVALEFPPSPGQNFLGLLSKARLGCSSLGQHKEVSVG